MSSQTSTDFHVLIIGAGVVGAALAQGFRKAGIRFTIFDRDAHAAARGQGWGITIHQALPTLSSLLPPHLTPLLHASQINPSTPGPQTLTLTALDASTGSLRVRISPNTTRLRVRRELFRAAMLSDLPVVWNKRLVGFSTTSSGVEAAFEDGTVVAGSVLVGTDGSGSEVRRILTPENHQLKQLPARCLGVSIRARHTEIAELLEIDPMLFMATHPGTHDFLWWSVLEMPEDKEEGEYTVLVSISWPVFGEADEVPVTAREQVAGMKRRARGFVDVLKRAVEAVPDDAVPFEIRVADWELVEWGDGGGRVTLAGDAAHAMTMFRGEAANHGIEDAGRLVEAMERVVGGEVGLEEALAGYQVEVRERCRPSVLASRQACFDAFMVDQPVEGNPYVEMGSGPLDETRR